MQDAPRGGFGFEFEVLRQIQRDPTMKNGAVSPTPRKYQV